ncbi:MULTISPECIES: enoyl-CoA hydratase/isomerase family protein [Gordonia]|uniref:enoyl-CoA hydratase/isomerase family protein n=1 Tax=Gordonia TaxID=2053 RepID=UPI0005EE5C11|nr:MULTISPECIES: enoyl-CoA hydratase-related protein [Gordonia]KJR08831.1 2,3-dehydroadipyl-CoA hydratase [Gordonia sihwensis]KXT58632.1 2,3-dehydroadipyl-CoA hydratase [Gordonia sp. QH-12]
MTGERVVREDRDGIVVLSINRPEAHNALNREVMEQLAAHIEACRFDESVRSVILTGSDRVFCAGADIGAFDALREETLFGPRRASGDALWAGLGSFQKPLIAAVEGVAFGGGCELALACDTVVAGESARFAVPEVQLGVIPGGGGTQRLVAAIGKAKAMAMLLTGDSMNARDAESAGLVASVAPAGEALDAALRMARRIARNSPLAVALAKDSASAALRPSLSLGLEYERRNFHVALRSDDSHEGQHAFLDKRTPLFNGR